MLKVKPVIDKKVKVEVKGNGCLDDCAVWRNQTSGTAGCKIVYTPQTTNLW